MNDLFDMTARAGYVIQTRPKAGRNREPIAQFEPTSTELERDSHFLYHHRIERILCPI